MFITLWTFITLRFIYYIGGLNTCACHELYSLAIVQVNNSPVPKIQLSYLVGHSNVVRSAHCRLCQQ